MVICLDASSVLQPNEGWHAMGRNRVEAADGRAVVYLFGDVDLAREAELIALFSDAVGMGQPVVVDAGGIDFVDSTGLRALLIAHQQCADAGTTLALRNVPSRLQRLLELSGVDALIPRVS